MKSYYEILGVNLKADSVTIRKNYLKLAKEWHPDKNINNPDAELKFKEIGEAYAVLSDPQERSRYDIFNSSRTSVGSSSNFSFSSPTSKVKTYEEYIWFLLTQMYDPNCFEDAAALEKIIKNIEDIFNSQGADTNLAKALTILLLISGLTNSNLSPATKQFIKIKKAEDQESINKYLSDLTANIRDKTTENLTRYIILNYIKDNIACLIDCRESLQIKESPEQLRASINTAIKILNERVLQERDQNHYQDRMQHCSNNCKGAGLTGIVIGVVAAGILVPINIATVGVGLAIASGVAFGAITGGIAFLVVAVPTLIVYCYCRYKHSQVPKLAEQEINKLKSTLSEADPVTSSILNAM